MKKTILFLSVAFLLTNCTNPMKIKTNPYPEARKDLAVVYDYFGNKVADPYHWLEDDNSAETAAWVKAENEVTFDYLSQIPYRGAIKERLTQLYDYPKYGQPFKKGDYYFFFKNDGLQNQSVLYYQKGLDGTPEVFLDPNKLSEDGTVALGGISFSNDDKRMAYTVSASGSDWVEIHVMEVENRQKTPDVIKWVKFSGAEWSKDGFYYSRYDEPAAGTELSKANEYQKVYYHTLGTPQSEDKLIYEDKVHPLRYFHPVVSKNDKYLFITASEGTSGNEILYKSLEKPGAFKVLLKGFENDYDIVRCNGDRLLLLTNHDAKNFRLVEMDLKAANPVMKDLIPEKPELLEGVSDVGGYLFANYLKDASSVVYQYDMNGTFIKGIELPAIGSANGFSGEDEDTQTFYTFSSFNYPPTIFAFDIPTGTSTVFHKTEVSFNPEDYQVEQHFFTSKDGTKVPMFIVHKRDLKKDGKNPLHLYGYGGFNISSKPSFSPSNVMFMEQGGVYVLVNLRGGGEYGETWHRAGMLENKQNVFDDFISAAEYLIEQKYTSKEKLAISGGSNGGLLIGACMTQRPDLFAVAFPRVGVLDMLRYHKFTVGWGWVVEYGNSEAGPDQFEYLYKYSPLHNIKPGVCYPATMVMTADHDDRVVPAHSFKFGATLQEYQSCDKPVLVRVDTKAGHGAGKPISKSLDEMADLYAFLFWNTNATVNFK